MTLKRRFAIALAFSLIATSVVIPAATRPALAQAAVCADPTLIGTEGDDVLDGTEVADVIAGLGGDDLIRGAGGRDVICGDAGDDVLRGGKGLDELFGGDGADVLEGLAGCDALHGNAGDDTLDGGTGREAFGFTTDCDAAWFDDSPRGVTVDLAAGTAVGDGQDTLIDVHDAVGSPFDDMLLGDSGANDLIGYFGDDVLDGREGQQDSAAFLIGPVVAYLSGGTAFGGEGRDTLRSIDDLVGSPFDDVLVGDEADNTLHGLGGSDDLWGRAGDDSFLSDTDDGADRIFGGAGTLDTVDYSDADAAVTVDLAAGTVAGGSGADEILGIEGAIGTHFADIMRGDNEDNFFLGGGGPDVIDGAGGDDFVFYFGSTVESTTADGGVLYGLTFVTGPVIVDLSKGTGVNVADPGRPVDRLRRIEDVAGSLRGDSLTGSDVENYLGGLSGNDRLFGLGADDYLAGGPGDDRIDGGRGARDSATYGDAAGPLRADLGQGIVRVGSSTDTLVDTEAVLGTPFGDLLVGGPGPDLLLGVEGNDRLQGLGGDDFLNGGPGADRLAGGPGFDYCVDAPRVTCESSNPPPEIERWLEFIERQLDKDDRLCRGLKLPRGRPCR